MTEATPCATARTLDDLLRHAVQIVMGQGAENVATRGSTREVIGARLELVNPRSRLSRTETRRKIVSAVAELCWYLRGTNDVAPIAFWLPRYAKEAEADGTVHGGYGPRLLGEGVDTQLHRVTEMLADGSGQTTRRAVIQVFDRRDIASPMRFKDVPCTCTMQFLRRRDGLHMIVNMRSNDAFIGLTHDVFCFSMLQEVVAQEIGAELGRYLHMVGSLHLYEDNLTDAKTFLDEGWQSTSDPMPAMPQSSQWNHIAQLLQAEQQLRGGASYAATDLPEDPYWADLARVLALHVARAKRPDEREARRIVSDLHHNFYSEFA